MQDDDPVCRHLRITGRVQGVGYRDWAIGAARARGLTGWVRNRADGSVEIVAAGGADAIAAFIRDCHKGPALARVTDVLSQDAEVPAVDGFEFRPTA